jgi:hypothetical protein|tara:strand:- start:888 stop:1103 length:216 start_codon:yes stop_codon:yes gene_type:complete
MITSNDTKTTPKKKAQDVILEKLALCMGYWEENSELTEGMTEREIELVNEQMKKECDRIAKKFGYNESWVA